MVKFPVTEPSFYRLQVKGWSLLSLSALGAAGVLALLLVLSRTPNIGSLLPWGTDFFYRALVTHVVLSFQVWFLTMLAVQFLLARPLGSWGLGLLGIAILSVIALIVPALLDQGQPLLNNYVPILVHPVFISALAILALVVAILAINSIPLLISHDPADFGTACAGLSYLSACLCFALAWNDIPFDTNLELATERTVWGGGHVLQLVNTVMLMIAWMRLVQVRWGVALLSPGLARTAFLALTVFALSAPLIYGLTDSTDLAHRQIFTRLLWLGLPVPPAIFALALFRLLFRQACLRKDPLYLSLALSVTVFTLGGLAGFFLGVGDTRTPSHYHAVIGGVNLGLMGLFPALILPVLGLKSRISRWSFLLYGGGQLLHALGFYAAGLAGVPRKTSGLSQGLDSIGKILSMGLVGLGGAIAVLGGILFIWGALRSLIKCCPKSSASIPFCPITEPQSSESKPVFGLVLVTVFLFGQWLSSPFSDISEPTDLDRAGFMEKYDAMVQADDTGEKVLGQPLIHPKGSDVYVVFRQWSIEPALVLDAGKSYRIHAMSLDVTHSISLLDREVLLLPGIDTTLVITAPESGPIAMQCGEFCGNGHSRMIGKIQIQ